MKKLPDFVEQLIIKAIRDFVPVSVLVEAFDGFKAAMDTKLRELAASTENEIDDLVVDKILEALNTCEPDADVMCGLIEKGEDYLIDMLKALALKSENKIDDALVELVAKALKA
jgi:hypothetical protein